MTAVWSPGLTVGPVVASLKHLKLTLAFFLPKLVVSVPFNQVSSFYKALGLSFCPPHPLQLLIQLVISTVIVKCSAGT